MIKYDYTVTVTGNTAKLDKDIYLFRGNKNVHYYFAVKNASFNFKGSTDLIEKTNAINAAVTVIKPNNVEVASAIAKVENGKIHLKVTEDLIDEEVEVGDFDLVFDLFDDTDGAVTIPKVIGQFHVLERPCTTPISELVATNTTNEVDQALTDYAIVTYAEPVASTNADGTFAKKTWVPKEKITTAELNRMEEGISDVSSQCKDIANLKNSTNVVDLEKYNITQADYEYPFTTENYKVAYQNGLGLQRAIDDAKTNNIQELIIPPGNYPLCYATNNHETVNSILTSVGVDLKGYGSKLYVIYDELDTGLNPYYTGDVSLAHAMCGVILRTDSDVEGIEFVGERAYRTTENAKYRESSYGIQLTKWSNGNKIKNCKTHHFSGDGIGAGIMMEQVATWFESDAVATAITWNGSEWVESTTSYTTSYHTVGNFDLTKPFQCRGSLYFIWTTAPLKFHCFDKEENYIGTVRVNQGEPFYFFKNTYRYYLEVTSSAPHETTATANIGIALGYGTYCNTIIEGCESYLNTRGGMSNLPSGAIVKNCRIYYNGCKFGNMVAFYDGTQFGIDIEDWYIHNITIDNCLIFGNLHGLLYRCNGINILDSEIYGTTSSLNYAVDFYAKNTKFKGICAMTTPASFGKKIAIGCEFDSTVADEIEIIKEVNEYKLPIANSETLGGVKPIAKTDVMTQAVGVNEDGLLYTAPSTASGSTSEGEFKKVIETTFEEDCYSFSVAQDKDGNLLQLKEGIICATVAQPTETATNLEYGIGFYDWVNSYNAYSSACGLSAMKNYEFYRTYVYFKVINGMVLAINLGYQNRGTKKPVFNDFNVAGLASPAVRNSPHISRSGSIANFKILPNSCVDRITIGFDMSTTGLFSKDSILEVWAR